MSHQFVPTGRLTAVAATTGVANVTPNASRYKVSNNGGNVTTGAWLYFAFGATAAAAVAAAAAPTGVAPSKLVFAIAPGVSEVIQLPPDAQQGTGAAAYFAASAACLVQAGGNN